MPVTGLCEQVWPASVASVFLPHRPLDRDHRVEGLVKTYCSPSTLATYWHLCCWICLQPLTQWITTFWFSAWTCTTVCLEWCSSASRCTWLACPSTFKPVPQHLFQFPSYVVYHRSPFLALLFLLYTVRDHRPDSAELGSRYWPTSVRRWYTDLRVLPAVCVTGALEHRHQLCWSCCQVDAFQQAPAEHCEDWDPVVYCWSSFSSTAAVITSS